MASSWVIPGGGMAAWDYPAHSMRGSALSRQRGPAPRGSLPRAREVVVDRCAITLRGSSLALRHRSPWGITPEILFQGAPPPPISPLGIPLEFNSRDGPRDNAAAVASHP